MSFTVAVGLYSACEAGAVFGDAQELHRSNKAPINVKVQNVLIESSRNACPIRGALYARLLTDHWMENMK